MRFSFGKLSLVLVTLFTLNACGSLFGRDGYFRDRGDSYVYAEEIPPMSVPEELDDSAITELFVIPPVSNDYVDPDVEFEAPRHSMIEAREVAQVKIQKLGTRRWIAINSPPGGVWPQVNSYLDEQSIKVAHSDAVTGEIETVWLRLKEEPETKDRYRLSVQQGLHPNTTEIHIVQITVDRMVPAEGKVNWPDTSMNANREAWMLNKLANHLARQQGDSISLLAQAIGGDRKVELVRPYQGDPFLLVYLDMDRTWATVSGAVSDQAMRLDEMVESERLLKVTFDPSWRPEDGEDEDGFFSRFFDFGDDDDNEGLRRYHIYLEEFDQNEIRVYVKDSNGNPVPHQEAAKILSYIRYHLV